MNATDNFKALAKRTGLSVAALRETAKDLGLAVSYSSSRRTWFLDESATVVRLFNNHLSV